MTRPDCTLRRGDRVTIRQHDWDAGEVEITGEVTRWSSPTHVMIRTDDGLIFAAPAELCTLATARQEAA